VVGDSGDGDIEVLGEAAERGPPVVEQFVDEAPIQVLVGHTPYTTTGDLELYEHPVFRGNPGRTLLAVAVKSALNSGQFYLLFRLQYGHMYIFSRFCRLFWRVKLAWSASILLYGV
jgi:hypothetical protein